LLWSSQIYHISAWSSLKGLHLVQVPNYLVDKLIIKICWLEIPVT
jgi:hypothetical protein